MAGRGKKLFYNTVLLTGISFLMHFVGLWFQMYLSRQMGASGLGLLYLALSVSGFAATVAISGSRFAATRIVSEEMGAGNPGGVKKTVRRCLLYACLWGIVASVLLASFSSFIGGRLIGDMRTVRPLELLSLSLPFLSMGAVLNGYFTAVGRVMKAASGQLVEQLTKIITVVLLFSTGKQQNPQWACCAIVFGNVISEFVSFMWEYGLYLHDRRKFLAGERSGPHIMGRVLKVAMPLALSAYARTALNSVQNLEIPRSLRRFGAGAEQALADYGRMQGMVFPIVTFPSALFVSLAEVLVPELTVAQVQKDDRRISLLVSMILRLCLLFSLFAAACFFLFGREMGLAFYSDGEAGTLIAAMALLMPVMYLDTVTDGMLRGLGQQLYVMIVNVADSVFCVILVVLLVPKWGVWGYLFVLYSSELLNFSFSIGKLCKLTKIRLPLVQIFLGVLSAVGAVNFALLFFRPLIKIAGAGVCLAGELTMSALLYAFLLFLTGVFGKKDIFWLKRLGKA